MTNKIPENTSKNTHHVVFEMVQQVNPDSVLDIPSGAGAFTQRLLHAGKVVYSGDIENILQIDNPNFVIADMNKPLPFNNNSVDCVVSIDGIEHLENPFQFIREANKVLKKNGTIIISTPNINAMRSRWRWFFTSQHNKNKLPLDEANPTPLHHINMMSFQRLRYILHTSGFLIDEVKTNRVKFISWIYVLLYPVAYLWTKIVFGKEKNREQRKRNQEILKILYSKAVYFGETLIVKAQKVSG